MSDFKSLNIDQGGTGRVAALTAGSILFSDGTKVEQDNANLFWDDTNNRLGLGTVSPDRTLHVKGDVSGGVALFDRTTSSTNATAGTIKLKATSSGDMTDGFGSAFGFYIQDTSAVENNIGDIRMVRAGADNTGDMLFMTTAAGTNVEKMRITSGGVVNIGGTATTEKFIVTNGNALFSSTYGVKWAAGSQLYEQTVALSGVDRMIYQPNGSRFDVINSAGSQFIAQFQSSAIQLYTGGTERFSIDSSGNVGVGISPLVLFHVGGSVDQVYVMYLGTEASGYNNGGDLAFRGAGGAVVSSIRGTYDTSNAGKIDFYTNVSGNTVKMTLLNDKLGIGQTSPTAVLDLTASTTTRASLRIRSGTAPTSPNDGDIWYDGADVKIRVGGTTKTFTIL